MFIGSRRSSDMSCGNKRGRPPGSSWKNATDYSILARVAEQIDLSPTLGPTSAMRLVGVDNPNDQKRLRLKWKGVSERYLLEARERREAAAAEAFRTAIQQVALVAGHALLAMNTTMQQARADYAQWAAENRDAADGLRSLNTYLRAHQSELASRRRIAG
jgi:hypothetical protein